MRKRTIFITLELRTLMKKGLLLMLAILLLYVFFLFKENVWPVTAYRGAYQTVVIDPGHGGIDGGTGDPSELLEKHVNLNVAIKLREILDNKNFNVVMTRDKDVSLEGKSPLNASRYRRDLDARKRIINEHGDIFVSIHVNAQPNRPEKRGVQIFYYPSSEESRKLANEIRIAVNDTVYKKFLGFLGTDNIKAEMIPNDYYVLRETNVSGVLIEIGFITNYEDKRLLASERYHKKIALAITNGILEYFQRKNL